MVFSFLLGAAFVWMFLSPSPLQLLGAAPPAAAKSKSNQPAAEFNLAELNSLIEQVLSVAEADLDVDNREILDRAQALGMIAAVSASASISLNNRYHAEEEARKIAAGDEHLKQLEQKKQELLSKREAILAKPAARSVTPLQPTTQKTDATSTTSPAPTTPEIDAAIEALDETIQQAKQSTEETRDSFEDAIQKMESMMQMQARVFNLMSSVMKTKTDSSKNAIKNTR
jgi:hypothetical protein